MFERLCALSLGPVHISFSIESYPKLVGMTWQLQQSNSKQWNFFSRLKVKTTVSHILQAPIDNINEGHWSWDSSIKTSARFSFFPAATNIISIWVAILARMLKHPCHPLPPVMLIRFVVLWLHCFNACLDRSARVDYLWNVQCKRCWISSTEAIWVLHSSHDTFNEHCWSELQMHQIIDAISTSLLKWACKAAEDHQDVRTLCDKKVKAEVGSSQLLLVSALLIRRGCILVQLRNRDTHR